MFALLAQSDISDLIPVVGLIVILVMIGIFPAILAGLGKMVGASPAKASWFRALLAIILCAVVEFVLAGVLTFVLPIAGTIVGLLIALLFDAMIVGWIFGISSGKGLAVVFLFDIATVVILVVLVAVLGVALGISFSGLGLPL
jgi:hypothetical protein